ncbi:hypothetical protein K1719_047191 [Acacia pycnantha]|nr:hypothetical protein K1719_047191 [Acacia pycnantha]
MGAHRPTPERAVPRHAVTARAASHDRGDDVSAAYPQPGLGPPPQSASVHAPSRSADRLSPFHIRPGRTASPHPLPSRQFQALFDSLFKVLFIFPSRYLFAIGLSPHLALDGIYRPIGAAFPNNPTRRRASWCGHDGALTLSGAPFQGTWARSAAEDASPDYNSDAGATDSHGGLFPVRSPLLGESSLVSFPPLIDMLKLSG